MSESLKYNNPRNVIELNNGNPFECFLKKNEEIIGISERYNWNYHELHYGRFDNKHPLIPKHDCDVLLKLADQHSEIPMERSKAVEFATFLLGSYPKISAESKDIYFNGICSVFEEFTESDGRMAVKTLIRNYSFPPSIADTLKELENARIERQKPYWKSQYLAKLHLQLHAKKEKEEEVISIRESMTAEEQKRIDTMLETFYCDASNKNSVLKNVSQMC